MIPLAAWYTIAAVIGTFGGIVFWGHEQKKIKNGDSIFVKPEFLSLAVPGSAVSLSSLIGLGGLVRVDNVNRVGDVCTGTAGKEVGLSVPVKFLAQSPINIERSGQRFENPELAKSIAV